MREVVAGVPIDSFAGIWIDAVAGVSEAPVRCDDSLRAMRRADISASKNTEAMEMPVETKKLTSYFIFHIFLIASANVVFLFNFLDFCSTFMVKTCNILSFLCKENIIFFLFPMYQLLIMLFCNIKNNTNSSCRGRTMLICNIKNGSRIFHRRTVPRKKKK